MPRYARHPKIGIRDLGTGNARLTVHDAAADAPAILLLGPSQTSFAGNPLPLSLDAIGLPCLLHTSVDVFLASRTGATGIAAGYAAFDVPLRPVFPGYDVFAQWRRAARDHDAADLGRAADGRRLVPDPEALIGDTQA